MCGIVGLRRLDGGPVSEALLREMTSRLTHRGPDEEGLWIRGGTGLGHRRLSIIDLAGSRQPMSSACDRVHLCYNGEVFNYGELREELAAKGHEFRTRGDTEVLLALHLLEGPAGVRRVQGQFAYAVVDERSGELWLVRDRLGILPLYWVRTPQHFAFASEIKALLPALPGAPEVDEESLQDYLAHRSVPAPYTLFRGIRKLRPGQRLRLDAAGETSEEPYWELPNREPERVEPGRAVELVHEALERAVSLRLVADVPVGAFLSGGVDSSLITALVKRARNGGSVETYAAGFDDPSYDELPFAEQVSRHLGTEHHPVRVSASDFLDLWHTLTWHRDAPLSEPADVAVYKLAKVASERVKVLLSGEGSDEIFAGYPKYRYARVAQLADLLPGPLRRGVLGAAERALPFGAGRVRTMLRAMTAAGGADRFEAWFAPFLESERKRLLPVEGRDVQRPIADAARGDLVQRMLYVDCHAWLADNLLERGDRMSMAASVEVRPPFLDHELVELAFRLPSDVKIRDGRTKWVLKQVARRYLPENIVDRPKVGFRVPLDRWFRGGLQEVAHDLLLSRDSFASERFQRDAVETLLRDHTAGRRNEEIRIWTLLCLEVWHRVFFRGESGFGG